jgi:hypothetical protein
MLVGILILAYRNFTVEGLYFYRYVDLFTALTFPYTNVKGLGPIHGVGLVPNPTQCRGWAQPYTV